MIDSRTDGRVLFGAGLGLVVAVFALYWEVTDHFFLNDDFGRLLALQDLRDQSLAQALWALVDNPYHGAYYRPLTNLAFYAIGQGAGLDPFWYYASSIALHAAAVLAVFAVLGQVVDGEGPRRIWLAAAGALVFAVHPRHVESVSYVHDNENVICGLFFFLGLYFGVRLVRTGCGKYLVGMGCALFLSLLGKEMGIVLPAVWVLYAVIWREEGRRAPWRSVAAVAVGVLVFYFCLRLNGLGELVGGVGETGRLEFSPLRMGRTLAQAGVGMVVPNGVPGLEVAAAYFRDHLAAFAAVLIVAFAGVGYMLAKCWTRQLAFGVLLVAVSALPILNNGISVDKLTGGRYLYIPLLGFALVVVDLVSRLPGRAAPAVAVAVLVGFFSVCTVRNNQMVSFAAEICEGVLKGMGKLEADGRETGEYVVLVPGFYRGLYVMGGSLQPGLELLYGDRGRSLAKRVALVLKLQIGQRSGLGVDVEREGDALAIACRGEMGFLWKAEFEGAVAERNMALEFTERETVNLRGDFVARKVEVRPAIAHVVFPDFAGDPQAGIALRSF